MQTVATLEIKHNLYCLCSYFRSVDCGLSSRLKCCGCHAVAYIKEISFVANVAD